MAYSSGDTDKNDASQMVTTMNFAIFVVTIFLRGNLTRQKRSNAIAVNVKIEHDKVESEMKLADLHTIIPRENPSFSLDNTHYPIKPVVSSCYLPGQSSRHVADGNQDICCGHVYDQAIRYSIESSV